MLTLDINNIIFECVLDHHNGQLTSRPYSVGLPFSLLRYIVSPSITG